MKSWRGKSGDGGGSAESSLLAARIKTAARRFAANHRYKI